MLEDELEGYQLLTDPCCGQEGFSVSLLNDCRPIFFDFILYLPIKLDVFVTPAWLT